MSELERKIADLAKQRVSVLVARARVDGLQQEMQALAIAEQLRQASKVLAEALNGEQSLSVAVREEALRAFRETGDKRPAGGVQIRIGKRAAYDQANMVGWLRANAPVYLEIDPRRTADVVGYLAGADDTANWLQVNDAALQKAKESLPGAPLDIVTEPSVAISGTLEIPEEPVETEGGEL